MPGSNGGAQLPEVASMIGELAHIRAIMEALLADSRDDITQIVVGNFERRETVLEDAPVPGSRGRRLIVSRPGFGQDGTINFPLNQVTPILQANENALGRNVQNASTTNSVRLYLANAGDLGGAGNPLSPQAQNRPCVNLFGNAANTWNGLLSNALYAGPVCAVAVGTGTGNVYVAEF